MQIVRRPRSDNVEPSKSARASSPPAARCDRRSSRCSTNLRGLLGFPGLRLRLTCVVLDMSSRGARVLLDQPRGRLCKADELPEAVVLALPTDRVEVTGTIRWRKGPLFGMRFTSAFLPTHHQFERDHCKEDAHLWVAGNRKIRFRK